MHHKNPIVSTLSRLAFYAMAALLFFWTATLTVDFIGYALPDIQLARYFALVVFDGGVLIWLIIFLNHAEGIGQRATGFFMIFFDLVGLLLIILAELSLGGNLIATTSDTLTTAALWGIGIWTFVNVTAVVIFHLTDVETMKDIVSKTSQDKITAKSLQRLQARTDEIADEVANQLAETMVNRTLLALDVEDPRKAVLNGKSLPEETESPLVRPVVVQENHHQK